MLTSVFITRNVRKENLWIQLQGDWTCRGSNNAGNGCWFMCQKTVKSAIKYPGGMLKLVYILVLSNLYIEVIIKVCLTHIL